MARPAALLLIAAALGLAACGGGDDTLDAGEYRAELTAGCESSAREAAALPRPASEEPEALGAYFRTVVELTQAEQEDFEALRPPEEFAQLHDESARLGTETVELLDEIAGELEAGQEPEGVLSGLIPRLNEGVERSNEISEELDVPACVVEPIPDGPQQTA
jgi:hypothetical protein